ncbi:MAG: response regulator [bacterium]|nr:response regulator [bacterium]
MKKSKDENKSQGLQSSIQATSKQTGFVSNKNSGLDAKILILSEDSKIRETITSFLKEAGYSTISCSNNLESLTHLKQERIDLLILDSVFENGGYQDFVGLVENISLNKSIGLMLLVEDFGESFKFDLKTTLRNLCTKRDVLKREVFIEVTKKALDPSYDPSKEEKKLTGRILVIEAGEDRIKSLMECLHGAGLEAFSAENANVGTTKAREKLPDVILVSANLPDKKCVELIKEFHNDPALSNIPVLMLWDEGSSLSIKTEAFLNGALGCISYPMNPAEILAQVGVLIKLTQAHSKLQEHAVTLAVSNFELEEARALLDQKRKELEISSEFKSEFLAKMSHELRTPLTAMMGYAQKVLHMSPEDPESKDAIHTVMRNGEHLMELINDILDLSKIEAGKLSLDLLPCSPGEILQDVQALMKIRAEQKGLAFWIEYQGEMPERIITDQTRLKQILLNLVGNAIKFTQKGSVKIGASCNKEANTVSFQIVDTGIGIPADKKDKLFTAFEQGDISVTRRFGGTGLGLTISLQLAEMLGGNVYVDSILGMGSSFKVEIKTGPLDKVQFLSPIELERTKYTETSSLDIKIERLSGRILIAEDNVDNKKLLEFYFKKSGADFLIVDNGQEALNKALIEPFDIVLLDMQMPVMDGYSAAKKLRDRGFVKPIIGITANNMESEVKKCLNAGCDLVLGKPYNWNKLFTHLKEHIGAKGENTSVIKLAPTPEHSLGKIKIELEDKTQKNQNFDFKKNASLNDKPILSEMYNENPDFQPLIIEFLEGLQKYINSVEESCATKNWAELKAVSHDISGVAGMYGYSECSEISKKLRIACMQKEEGQIDTLSKELVANIRRMELGLKVFRGEKLESSPKQTEETVVISSELFDVSPELGPEILEFLDGIDGVLQKLNEATQSMNWTVLSSITNEVSGTASLFGYPTFATAAKNIEEAITKGETANLPKMIVDLTKMKEAMVRGRKGM